MWVLLIFYNYPLLLFYKEKEAFLVALRRCWKKCLFQKARLCVLLYKANSGFEWEWGRLVLTML